MAPQAFATLKEALAGLNWVCATTARQRDLAKAVLTPEQAVAEMRRRIGEGQRCGILFGPERNGLETEEVANADAVVMAPVNPNFASLNLAQAVLLIGYEWMKQADAGTLGRVTTYEAPLQPGLQDPRLAAGDQGGADRPLRAARGRARQERLFHGARKAPQRGAKPAHACSRAWARRSKKSAPCGESSRPWRAASDPGANRHSYASFSIKRCAHAGQGGAANKNDARTALHGLDNKGRGE